MGHPWSDGPSGKADALKKLVYYFRVFHQNMFFRHELKKVEEILHVHVTLEFSE